MPVIRDYRPQTSAPGPISQPAYSPDQFGAEQGRAMGNLGQSVQEVAHVVAKKLDQENTADVTAKLAKTHADLAIDLQNTIRTADPSDKQAFEDFQQRADEAIGKVGDDASTESARRFFTEASAKVKGSLAETSAAGQAELAGVKAVNDYTTTLNSFSAAATADPSSLDLQRDLHRQTIETMVSTGRLSSEKAIQLQRQGDTELTKSAIRGWINLNPDYAKQKLKSGVFDSDLGSEGKVQLAGEADQAIRAKEIEEERRQRQQEKIKKAAEQQTQNGFLQKMVDGNLSTKDVLGSNLEAFGSGSKEQFLNLMKMRNSAEEKLKTDPGMMISLFDRINLPDGDPQKLVDENELNQYFGHGLSMPDLNRLREEMQGKHTEQGKIEGDMKKQVLEIAKGKLTKSNPFGLRDPVGDEQFARFSAYFFDEYKTQRAQGVPAKDLLTPDSPKYLGKNISQYVRTNQQIIGGLVPRRTPPNGGGLAITPQTQGAAADQAPTTFQAPAPPQRKSGESAADYLRRVKGGQ